MLHSDILKKLETTLPSNIEIKEVRGISVTKFPKTSETHVDGGFFGNIDVKLSLKIKDLDDG